MKTDRELLELAAKAAGFSAFNAVSADVFFMHWNPLIDDGDALRLAVKLGLLVDLRYAEKNNSMRRFNRVSYWPTEHGACLPIELGEHDDTYAATRRAIVLAAAELGRAMP